jgi:hypothetical protein
MKNWKELCEVKTFHLDGREVPAVSLGTSPFIGAGQFDSRARDYYTQFYQNPENMEKIIAKSIELGVPAIHAIAYDRIIEVINRVQQSNQVKIFCSITIGLNDWRKEIYESKIIDPQIAFIHGTITDARNMSILGKMMDEIMKAGIIPGCATHNPLETIPFLEGSGLDIKIYFAPVNPTGRYLGREPQRVIELLKNAARPVIGKKVLAAGRIEPERAFSFVSKIHNIKGIAVGIASLQEAEETFGQAKKFWSNEA